MRELRFEPRRDKMRVIFAAWVRGYVGSGSQGQTCDMVAVEVEIQIMVVTAINIYVSRWPSASTW